MTAALLLAGLLTTAQAPVPPPPTQAQAVDLATRGDYRAALAIFQRLVAANPADQDSLLWIARLHGRLGDRARAEAVYRGVLAGNPGHADALVGLGTLVLNAGRPREALDLFVRAETAAPGSADVLAALARVYQRMGQTSVALRYIDRAVAAAPTPDNRSTREQIRSTYAHRIESSAFVEQLGGDIPDGRSGELALNLRLSDAVRISARGQVQDKFGLREQRAGGGIEWRAGAGTTLAVTAIVGENAQVLPRRDGALELSHARGRFEWAGGLRYIEFASARVGVASPGLTVWRGDTLSLTGRYYFAVTDYVSGLPLQESHSGLVRLAVRPLPRLWLSAGYSRGTESFETLSPDRIGEFRADTGSAGVRLDLPTLTSIAGSYERQQRSTGSEMSRFTLSLVQRF